MRNLRQLHFCKAQGALGTFDTNMCLTCPYREMNTSTCSSTSAGSLFKRLPGLIPPMLFLTLALAAGKPDVTLASVGIAWSNLLDLLCIDTLQAGIISKALSGGMALASLISLIRFMATAETSQDVYQGYLRCGS